MGTRDVVFTILAIDEASKVMEKTALGAEAVAGKFGAFGEIASKAFAGVAVGAGAAAIEGVKMAGDFQSTMEQLHTTAGVGQGAVDSLSKGVLGLAGKVATDPDSLAEALYHIESSFASTGISGSEAMHLLQTSAEGAKIGHADLVDVTNALDAAVTSGIPGVKNFDQAMGALNATVGSGDMHMQDLAEAFGTGVLASVKTYGLSLKDVGAALAVFGDNNIRGAEAGTQLRMAVQSLAVPAKTGKAALDELGLKSDTLAKAMQHGGLNEAMTVLNGHLKQNGISTKQAGQILAEAFGKKAGVGINILEDQFGRLQTKYEELNKGSNTFGDAWKSQQATFKQQWESLKASIDVVLIQLGTKLIPIIQSVVKWMGEHKTATLAIIGAFAGFVGILATFGLYLKIMGAVKTAIELWKGAQVALNLVMEANPIILIITAIIALGVAIYELYQHSETFRKIVNAVWTELRAVAGTTWSWLKSNVFGPLVMIMEAIGEGARILAAIFTAVLLYTVDLAWKAIRVVISAAWSFIKPIFDLYMAYLRLVGSVFMWLWTNAVVPAFNGIRAAGSAAWSWINTNVFTPLRIVLVVVGQTFMALWTNYISPAWNSIKSGISTAWNWINSNVFGPIKTGIGAVGSAFDAAQRAIGTAWNKIEDAAKVPVRFVINTVIRDGIVAKYNDIAGMFHVPKINFGGVNFAAGGPVKGAGHGTSDDVPIMASHGEWVIRAKAAAQLGHHVMTLINNADVLGLTISGDPGSIGVRRKYATGGPVDPSIVSRVASVTSWLPSLTSVPYVWGAVGPGGYDCSGLVGEVWARLTGRPSYRRYMTTNTILDSPGSLGLTPGPGLFTIGVSREHTDGNLAGLGFEAPHTGVNIRIGGAAQPTSNFPSQFHLTSLGTAGASSGGGGFDPWSWAKSAASSALNALTGGWWSKLGGLGGLGQLAIGFGKSVLSAIFDTGGFLMPGTSLVHNGTGAPEAVLTAAQWGDVHAVARLATGGSTTAARLAGAHRGGDIHIHVPVTGSVIGNEQQLAKTITQAITTAASSGTLGTALRRALAS